MAARRRLRAAPPLRRRAVNRALNRRRRLLADLRALRAAAIATASARKRCIMPLLSTIEHEKLARQIIT